jgi:hypothetical protein
MHSVPMDEKLERGSRRRILATTCTLLVVFNTLVFVWSIVFRCYYYAEDVSISVKTGHIALYWGGERLSRNESLLNGLQWPSEGGGVTGLLTWSDPRISQDSHHFLDTPHAGW